MYFNLDPTTITFLIYIIIMFMIGFLAYFYTKNFSDFILGGRRLGSFVTAMSTGASDMSGWLLMGLPGTIYLSGLSNAWIAIGLCIGSYLNWLLISGRIRIFTEINHNALTLPNYFNHRFGKHGTLLKIISSSIILIFFTIYCASGVVASARLFENIFHIDYSIALWLGALATIIYTFVGGFLAISWTDTIQATLIVFALIFAPLTILIYLGGYHEAQTLIQAAGNSVGKHFNQLINHETSWITLFSCLAWGLGYFGQPHILSRFMAAKSVPSLIKARKIGMIWMIFSLFGAIMIGYLGIAYFYENQNLASVVNTNSEQVFIELSKILFNPWIAGILLSAILAALMSTLSCQLLICSSSVTADFYKGFLRPYASQKELVLVGRMMILIIALIAIYIASDENSRVLTLVSNAWAGFGSSFGPVILLSLYWKRMTTQGALAGMISGALIVGLWKTVFPESYLYEMVPGFLCAFSIIIIVSLLTPPPSKNIRKQFDQADNLYRQTRIRKNTKK